jgi:hypothetical protein
MKNNQDHRKDNAAPTLQLATFGAGVEDVLAGIHAPIAPAVEKQAREAIRLEAQRLKQHYRELKSAELHQSEAREATAGEIREQTRARLGEAEQALAAGAAGLLAVGLLALACFAACFGAEYVFNAAVLPWLLGLRPGSVLAVALGIAPATAPLILDRILPRLFQLEDPAARVTATATASRTAQRIVTVLFLLAVIFSTLGSIYLVADCREVASILANRDTVTEIGAAQQHVIRLAIVALSVVLCINGALFYLFGASEVRKWWMRETARQNARKARAADAEAHAAHTAAASDLDSKREAWEHVAEAAETAGEVYQARNLLRLAVLAQPAAPPATCWGRVGETLDRGGATRPAGPVAVARQASA